MADKPWKAIERRAAKVIGGPDAKRCWANSGKDLDYIGPTMVAQVKHVKHISGNEIGRLVNIASIQGKLLDPPRLGVVYIKMREGQGKPTRGFVVIDEADFMVLRDAIRAESWRT